MLYKLNYFASTTSKFQPRVEMCYIVLGICHSALGADHLLGIRVADPLVLDPTVTPGDTEKLTLQHLTMSKKIQCKSERLHRLLSI